MSSRTLRSFEVRPRCPRGYLPASTRRIRPLRGIVGQGRAVEALRLGISLRAAGYNIFVTGLPGTGRTATAAAMVRRLQPRPARELGYAYVMNWDDPDRPTLLAFPRGEARAFRDAMGSLVRALRRALPRTVSTGRMGRRRDRVASRYQAEERKLLGHFEKRARKENFVVMRRRTGDEAEELDLQYLVRGRAYTLDGLDDLRRRGRLRAREYHEARKGYDRLRAELEGVMRRGRSLEAKMERAIDDLEERAAERILDEKLARLRKRFTDPKVQGYLDGVREAALRDLDLFTQDGEPARGGAPEGRPSGDPFAAYRVNVIQEAALRERPPIVEPHPTYRNLFGAIERIERPGGALVADFQTIRSGACLRADGGVLILNAADVLEEPYVFRTLRRVLRSGKLEIQDPEPSMSYAPTALKPEPIDVDVKVILVGDELCYEQIWDVEEDFEKLFKVKAEFDDTVPFDRRHARGYAAFVARTCREEKLLPVLRPALGRLLDEARRRTGRSRLLSARLEEVADLVRESSHIARARGATAVGDEEMAAAVLAQERRQSLLEEKVRKEIREGALKIETRGARVGSVNSLVVFDVGGYSFGKPSRVTAAVAPGTAGIINIEREANLSGKTHDKGMLIMAGYLRRRFASERPLSLSASLCLEQSYGGVDGDSASLAECLALLSALSDVPLRQSSGVTGALDQHGSVLAVGGVTEKVEGFYKLVAERGFPERPCVLIPESNAGDLMVSDTVAQEVKGGRFEVCLVSNVEDALEVMAPSVPVAELFSRVQERLHGFQKVLRESAAQGLKP